MLDGGRGPVHPLALEALQQGAQEGWADVHGLHHEGRRAAAVLAASRAALADAIGVRPEDVRFTPSHVASLHTAVAAVAPARRLVGRGVVVSAVERAALLAAARHVAGDDVVEVGVDASGRVDARAFADAVAAPGTGLACLQHANGEVGTLQPVGAAHEAARRASVPLLVDAGASFGHVDVGQAWDVLALDPASWGGVPGVGVVALRPRVRTTSWGPEDAEPWAPGGVSTAAAYAAAVSLQAVLASRAESDRRRRALVARLRDGVARLVPDVQIAGDPDERLPHVLTFSCLYVDGEALLSELDRVGIAVGSGSACTSLSLEPSHVLRAMGLLTHGNVRIVLHDAVTEQDVDHVLAVLPDAVARVRSALGVAGL